MTLDCRTCGACCKGWVVDVDDGDPVPERLTKCDPITGERIMRERGIGRGAIAHRNTGCGACTALRGTIGVHVTCTIYDRRPTTCRMFEPGSDDCRMARRRAGVERDLDAHRRRTLDAPPASGDDGPTPG